MFDFIFPLIVNVLAYIACQIQIFLKMIINELTLKITYFVT